VIYYVNNKQEFEKAWAQVQAGDTIVVRVKDKAEYAYTFPWPIVHDSSEVGC
jgi:hypothetical protein